MVHPERFLKPFFVRQSMPAHALLTASVNLRLTTSMCPEGGVVEDGSPAGTLRAPVTSLGVAARLAGGEGSFLALRAGGGTDGGLAVFDVWLTLSAATLSTT